MEICTFARPEIAITLKPEKSNKYTDGDSFSLSTYSNLRILTVKEEKLGCMNNVHMDVRVLPTDVAAERARNVKLRDLVSCLDSFTRSLGPLENVLAMK